MFADPQSITIAGTPNSLPRLSQETKGNTVTSIYATQDESLKLTISHQTQGNGRVRSVFRLDKRAIVTNPLDSSNDYDTTSIYTVIDRPAYGFTVTAVQDLVAGLNAAMSSATVAKLYGKES
jgi:hypothetical protein